MDYGKFRAIMAPIDPNRAIAFNLSHVIVQSCVHFWRVTVMEIQSVGIKEFRANLQKYTKQTSEPIAITSHGVPIGYYIPTQQTPQKQDFIALQEAAQKIRQLLETKGITEDDLLTDFQNAQKNAR
jgi:PHD/YefM family antitoxin component YafN of YafNO toxin-antitoxin module